MAQRIGGFRRKTRHKLTKSVREKGKVSLSRYFQSFKVGEKITLVGESSIHEGMFHPRFHGKSGMVSGKRGKCYEIEIKDGSLSKTLVVHPVHLRKI